MPAKRGIGGAHNLDEFMKYSNEFKVVGTVDHPKVDGIKTIRYQVAARDPAGNFTGAFREKVFEKTVFDPSVIQPDTFLSWGRQAAAEGQALGPLNRTWTGTAPNGIKFMGYLDDTGAVRSFFPDF
ncbi:CdiA family toxin C-terminal domain-containing protein [Chitinimonas lacunae]|uniref:CdiA family toxin C-terminal domain-containing protein n=1 Tax=Chitinimonas lacunae TaxID=1963018 RepID=A0ABV8MNY8_9NEIS